MSSLLSMMIFFPFFPYLSKNYFTTTSVSVVREIPCINLEDEESAAIGELLAPPHVCSC